MPRRIAGFLARSAGRAARWMVALSEGPAPANRDPAERGATLREVDDRLGRLEERTRHDLNAAVGQLESLAREDNPLPIPPRHLQERSIGVYESDFIESGYARYDEFNAILGRAGRKMSDFHDILDFGCGCGRLTRAFAAKLPSARIVGVDIDREAVEWLRGNYGSIAGFEVNPFLPPMPFPDDSFDFLFSVSVFTHLPEEMQFAWLEETGRVTRPGGYLLHTIRARSGYRPDLLSDDERGLVEKNGFYYAGIVDTPGLPDFYQTAFHSHEYVRREWDRYFDVLAIVEDGVSYSNDAVLLRNR